MKLGGLPRPHTITRQVFDLHCPDSQRGQSLLQMVETDYETKILPVIERVLDGFAMAGYEIEIDRLVIDLGDVPEGSFAQALPQLVEQALQRQLQALLSDQDSTVVRRKPTADGEWEALIAFLETGLAPGWMEEKAFRPWDILVATAQDAPPRLRAYLTAMQRANPSKLESILQRIAGTPDPRVMPAMLQSCLGESAGAAMMEIWAWVAAVAKEIAAGSAATWHLRTALLAAALAVSEADERMFIFWEAESKAPEFWNTLAVMQIKSVSTAEAAVTPLQKQWHRWLATKAKAAANPPQATINPIRTPNKPTALPPQDRIYVSNAGLALVAAFLPAHFTHLELLDPHGQFSDPAAQMQALRHVETLASGLHPPDEHGLALTKLICGLDLTTPVDLREVATEADLATADALLQAVIAYWPIIGDIVPDQLRGGFLLRDGWLQAGQNDWTLRVERKAYDVVLQQLPWSIGMIALPWMKFKIWVEW